MRNTRTSRANYPLYVILFDKVRIIYKHRHLTLVKSLKDLRSMLLETEPNTKKGRDFVPSNAMDSNQRSPFVCYRPRFFQDLLLLYHYARTRNPGPKRPKDKKRPPK